MGKPMGAIRVAAAWVSGLILVTERPAPAQPDRQPREPLVLHARVREPGPAARGSGSLAGSFVVQEKMLRWDPARTAVIICDMWQKHWCQGASRRVAELAPIMNRAVAAARSRGVLIVHAPSSCMDYYKDHPARK